MVSVPTSRDRMTWARVVLCAALVAVIAVPGMVSAADTSPGPLPRVSAELPPGDPPFLKETAGLESSLAGLASIRQHQGVDAARGFAARRGLDSNGQSVEVMVIADGAGTARAAVRSLNGSIIRTAGDRVTARVPIARLRQLADSAGVLAVRAPTTPYSLGTVSEGVAEIGAAAWHDAGADGTGVKVGIIDAGFNGYTSLLGSELPSSVRVWPGGLGDSGVVHGTGVAEIVHDVAPGAELYFAGVGDSVDLYDAAAWMIGEGVTVINQSLAWFGDGPLDGTGSVNEVVSGAVADGVFWANAAGNQRERHWAGDYSGDPTGWHDFDPGAAVNNVNPFYAGSGRAIAGYLWWDDDWDAAAHDYDLVLYRYDEPSEQWSMYAYSANLQDGTPGSLPVERVWVGNPQSGIYGWAIYKYDEDAPTDVDFDLVAPAHQLTYRVMERSISIPADNPTPGFMSAGAVGRAPGFVLEPYSSQGPTRDGRMAPSVVLPSAVSSVSYGTFAGTSAASPHLAGAAALVAGEYPELGPADISNYLREAAMDLGDPNIFGAGIVLLPAPGVTPTPRLDIQHDAAGVAFDRFVTGYSSAYSGGGYVYGRWTGTRLQARFTGTKVRWVGPKQPNYGMADVYIDGVKAATVDCYAPEATKTLSATIWESDVLVDKAHNLEIRLVGAKNPASAGNIVVLDRLEAIGPTPKSGGVRHDETTGILSGPWIKGTNSAYINRGYHYSRHSSASFTATFTGTRVAWIGPKTANYGRARVYIDGVLQGTVSQYGATGWRERVWESKSLTPGTHTLRIVPTGTKDVAAKDAIIVIDAIDVR